MPQPPYPSFMSTAWKVAIFLRLWALLPVLAARAEPEILPDTASPAHGLVFALDNQTHTLSLVRLRDHACLASDSSPEFYGRPDYFSICWCRGARRVAITTGGRVETFTTVFDYTGNQLKEMDLPRPGNLPDRWFPHASWFQGDDIRPRRWRGPNLLELSVSGTAVYGEGKAEADFRNFTLSYLVRYDHGGNARIVHVTDRVPRRP